MYGGAVLIQPSTFFRRSAFERAGKFSAKQGDLGWQLFLRHGEGWM